MIDILEHNGTDVMVADIPVWRNPLVISAVIFNRDTGQHWLTNPLRASKHEGWWGRSATRAMHDDERTALTTRARRLLTHYYATTPLRDTCEVVAAEGGRFLVRRVDVDSVPTHYTAVIIDRVHNTATPTTMAIALAQFRRLYPPALDDAVRDALIAQAVQVFSRAGPTRAD